MSVRIDLEVLNSADHIITTKSHTERQVHSERGRQRGTSYGHSHSTCAAQNTSHAHSRAQHRTTCQRLAIVLRCLAKRSVGQSTGSWSTRHMQPGIHLMSTVQNRGQREENMRDRERSETRERIREWAWEYILVLSSLDFIVTITTSYKGMISWWDGGQKIRSIDKFDKLDKWEKMKDQVN